MTEREVVEWLKERQTHCLRIAANKRLTIQARAGWEEDASYFEAAIMLITGIPAREGNA